MRGEIAEAVVELRALIKAIVEFIEEVLPDTSLTQIRYIKKIICRVRYADCPETGNTTETSLNLFCGRSCI
jgi:hypothetical protein